jgi:hypothetical protein
MLNGNAGSGFFRRLAAVIGVEESPGGYSLMGCSSAAPASTSPTEIRMR